MMNYNLVIESSIQPWALKLIIFLQVKEFTLEVQGNVVCTVWATVKLHKDFIAQE
jgi:pyruvoyl-dependent arginine decarboxylase (PvlArgDC)